MIPSGTRFIGFSDSVNLTERRSASVNAETAPYTLDDIRGYKVYTALLTQSGGGGLEEIFSGDLIIGVTYKIFDDGAGLPNWDFTNVGAPNNDFETYFVATGTTPNSWGTGIGLLYNTGAPVVTVLENTIGNIWFTYSADGDYYINTSNNGFNTLEKIFSPISVYDAVPSVLITVYNNSNSLELLASSGNSTLNSTPIEIRVYN